MRHHPGGGGGDAGLGPGDQPGRCGGEPNPGTGGPGRGSGEPSPGTGRPAPRGRAVARAAGSVATAFDPGPAHTTASAAATRSDPGDRGSAERIARRDRVNAQVAWLSAPVSWCGACQEDHPVP